MEPRTATIGNVNAQELRVFLTLADELHFARAAERLYLSQPHVSRTLAALERRVGGTLLSRSSRSVSLTPLGEVLLAELRPAYNGILDAIAHARAIAAGLTGELIIGCTATTAVPSLIRIVDLFAHQHPECNVVLHEQPLTQPFVPLRNGEVDVLVWWHLDTEPTLTLGPVIDQQRRMALMRTAHPLANRDAVSLEDLAEYGFPNFTRNPELANLYDLLFPARTPTGRPIPRSGAECRTLSEAADLIARTNLVHATTESAAKSNAIRGDLVVVPIEDLPDVPLGLIWRTDREDARIMAFAATSTNLGSVEPKRDSSIVTKTASPGSA